MKRFRNEKGRMLSLLLSLVLTVGLIYANAVPASAAQGNTYSFAHAYDCQRAPAYPKKGNTFQASGFCTPLNAAGQYIGGDINENYAWMLTSLGNYGGVASPSTNLTSIVNHVAATYGVEAANVEVFQLTKDGSYIATGVIFARSPELTAFLGDNWNENGSTYLLSSSTLADPTTVTISQDVTTGFAPSHTHSWASVTSGNGTKEASAAITCPGCGETLKVTLTASDVILPGKVFTAKIGTEPSSVSSVRSSASPLTVSKTPGYKYSATGSDFAAIDPDNFTAKTGFYQASILVMDGNETVENLYVRYAASDPTITAATGDDRPIEMAFIGMAFFGAMAAAAFVLDGKRKGRR